MIEFKTAVGNGKYEITVITDIKSEYLRIEQLARDCVDRQVLQREELPKSRLFARWIKEYHDGAGMECCCSNCAAVNKNDITDYCPSCGACMEWVDGVGFMARAVKNDG